MDKPHQIHGTKLLTTEYSKGITQFMTFAENQEAALESGKMFCPCAECENRRYLDNDLIWRHLYSRGFMAGYKIWYKHGEDGSMVDLGSTSAMSIDERIRASIGERTLEDNVVGTVQMIHDVYPQYMMLGSEDEARIDEPNAGARKFFDMLDACERPLYDGCKEGHSALSTSTKLMNIKTSHNLSEECVDEIAEFVKDVLPEGNICPGSYREIEKLVDGLGLPYEIIDVCIDNCMIYWEDDACLDHCRHCGELKYKEKTGKTSIPYKRMWYFLIGERLKRLYQAERTAKAMRWHAEHKMEGEILHPSDAEAWDHIQKVYPIFASEPRNVYIGLSTDGFNPFGKYGRNYSLWPVIVTPYNLLPSLCMRREFLYLAILVPGPDHPKKALDVFLQPLIRELKNLWEHGVEAYDVSCKQNFQMRVVLMWTISDFTAYSMLSGSTTHGKLSCPYCQEETDAFGLSFGRKMCWFDCHRRFLPIGHPYRRCKKSFRKNRRSLTLEGIQNLEVNIPVILCNLEKILPPSFFDVMEHLPIHLPREARLGGPVQYRWIYPFERYMFHLKKKVKNLNRVEGSIANQVRNEERSNFERNAKNRKGRDCQADSTTHNNGSRPFERTEDELTIKGNGIKPDYMTLMEITHTNKKTKEVDNKRVKNILTNAKKKVQHLATQRSQLEGASLCSLSTKEINQIVYEEATTDKGVNGLGIVPLRNQKADTAMTSPPTQLLEQTISSLEDQLKAEIEERKKMQEFLKTLGYA